MSLKVLAKAVLPPGEDGEDRKRVLQLLAPE